MAKVKLNPIVEQVRGQVGDLVFRNLRGDTILSSKPDFSGVQATEQQIEHRERFKRAVAYGRMVMADNETRELYEQAADRKGTPAFALTVADFMNAPAIDEVDVSDYGGQTGDPIYIRTHDDFGVQRVDVNVSNGSGTVLEDGQAVVDAGTGRWVYLGQTNLATGTTIRIEVSASDRPGGTARQQQAVDI